MFVIIRISLIDVYNTCILDFEITDEHFKLEFKYYN